MGAVSGLGDNFYIAGYDLSGNVSSLDQISGGPALLDVTPIVKSANQRIGGLRDGDLQFTSFFDIDAGAEHPALSGLPTADVVATYFRGAAIGNPAASIVAKQLNYDPTRDTAGGLTLKVECQANGFGTDWGTQATSGLRTDTSASYGGPLDLGAGSSFGMQAYLQVVAFTGTDVTVAITESTDNNNDYNTTVLTFAQTTAAHTAQRVAVSGTVDRYLKVFTSTSGGFSSVTFAVMVAVNLTAVSF